MNNIEVTYDGEYPCACMGTLTIKENGKEIYHKKYCCHSTGNVWIEYGSGQERIEIGELIWDEEDAEKFSKEIQYKVKETLLKAHVCCGGCL